MPDLEWSYGAEYVPLDVEADTVKMRDELTQRLENALPDSARSDSRSGPQNSDSIIRWTLHR